MLSRSRRPSPQTMKVLETLAADSSAWRYGYELGLEVGLRSGSLYPILVRLCDRDLLEAKTVIIETKRQQLVAVVNTYQALGGGAMLALSIPEPPLLDPVINPVRGHLHFMSHE